jgi:hypothetical protein
MAAPACFLPRRRASAGASVRAEVQVSAQDYRINAEVRRHLVSRWVDVARLQLGTTNGVVYLLGHLSTTMEDPVRRLDGDGPAGTSGERILELAIVLDKELRRLRDVRDVVFKLDNACKRGGRWRIPDGTAFDPRPRRVAAHRAPGAPAANDARKEP